MEVETVLAIGAGLAISIVAIALFAQAERLLPALVGAAVPPSRARRRWASVGVFLLLLTVPITVWVWRVTPEGPWPAFAFALPSLPLVLPAWHCFKRAGWGTVEKKGGKGVSALKFGCILALITIGLLFIGGIAADSLGLLR
ncbi:MAG TPA: hypothetical protein VGJ81_22150 [Thermoanaerobaculia bacterium]|jgi:hypothetical protein